MEMSDYKKSEMVRLVAERLAGINLNINNPGLIARNLLTYYNYDIEKVLQLTI